MARLRALSERPIAGGQRHAAFALAAAIVLAAGSALILTRPAQRPPPRTSAPAATQAPAPPPPAASAAASSAVATSSARRAARRFLAGYLPFLYGRRPDPRSICCADAGLLRALRHQRVRPTPALRRRRPRVVWLRARSAGRGVAVVALIDDGGVARYRIGLLLSRPGGWHVSAVEGD
ncbi:MAG: hypothetical protein QOE65_1139 [Solirubrobacteraceae bacterium]|nr:hypothetical protein [Solirubrobacteraceae bacterium]